MRKETKGLIYLSSVIMVFIAIVVGLVTVFTYLEDNGVYVYTGEPNDRDIEQLYDVPIKVSGHIRYDGDFIMSKDTIVEFCKVKKAKKEMKQKMNAIWKEMKNGCED